MEGLPPRANANCHAAAKTYSGPPDRAVWSDADASVMLVKRRHIVSLHSVEGSRRERSNSAVPFCFVSNDT